MSSIDSSSTRIGEDSDKNMFLNIERPRIKGEPKPGALEEDTFRECPSHEVSQWNHSNLSRNRSDSQRLCSVPKELVHKGQNHTGSNSQNPHSECENRQAGVICFGHSEIHLSNWTLFFYFLFTDTTLVFLNLNIECLTNHG